MLAPGGMYGCTTLGGETKDVENSRLLSIVSWAHKVSWSFLQEHPAPDSHVVW